MAADRTFADVVEGRTAVHRVYDDDRHIAFLAEQPLQPGHVILITRHPYPYLFDLPEPEYAALWAVARRLAQRLQRRLGCERVCTAVVGWAVRHAHVHLVPTTAPGQFPPLGGPAAAAADLAALAVCLRGED